jgi:hypothetical protein
MNDLTKTNIQTKLNKAVESEGLSLTEAGRCIGIMPNYLSMIRNEGQWEKCGVTAWDTVLKWVNSGQSLREYSEKHGKVLPENKEQKQGTIISRIIETKPIEKNEIRNKSIIKELVTTQNQRQKVIIDIEINLIINGEKIKIN